MAYETYGPFSDFATSAFLAAFFLITISYPVLLNRLRNTAGNLSKTASALGAMAGETGKKFGARLQQLGGVASLGDLGSQGGGLNRQEVRGDFDLPVLRPQVPS